MYQFQSDEHSLSCLLSGSAGLRFEKLPEEWFDYNIAFPTVTDFYSKPEGTASESLDTTRLAEGKL